MLRAFEGVHAGSALEQSEMYNDEEVYKLDNMLLLQSEEEAEQVNEEKLSPKEQVELDVMANNVVFLLNQFAKDKDAHESRVLQKVSPQNSKGGGKQQGGSRSSSKQILKRPAPSSQGTSRQPSSSSNFSRNTSRNNSSQNVNLEYGSSRPAANRGMEASRWR